MSDFDPRDLTTPTPQRAATGEYAAITSETA